jgi:hypothetical protein
MFFVVHMALPFRVFARRSFHACVCLSIVRRGRYFLQSGCVDKRGEGNDIHESPVMNRIRLSADRRIGLLMRQPHRRFVIAIALLQVH